VPNPNPLSALRPVSGFSQNDSHCQCGQCNISANRVSPKRSTQPRAHSSDFRSGFLCLRLVRTRQGGPRGAWAVAVRPKVEFYYTRRVGVMETTYVSMTNPPTNQPPPTPPDAYLSLRVSTPHHFWKKIEPCVNKEDWYISWTENGKSGTNPHFQCALARISLQGL
jgi:hypothetical protein